MNYYEITLWVTLEQETAIYELFKQRSWIYPRTAFSDPQSTGSYVCQKERNISSVDYITDIAGFGYQDNERTNLVSNQTGTFCRKGQETSNDKVGETSILPLPHDSEHTEKLIYEDRQHASDKLNEKINFACDSPEKQHNQSGSFEQHTKQSKHIEDGPHVESSNISAYLTVENENLYKDIQGIPGNTLEGDTIISGHEDCWQNYFDRTLSYKGSLSNNKCIYVDSTCEFQSRQSHLNNKTTTFANVEHLDQTETTKPNSDKLTKDDSSTSSVVDSMQNQVISHYITDLTSKQCGLSNKNVERVSHTKYNKTDAAKAISDDFQMLDMTKLDNQIKNDTKFSVKEHFSNEELIMVDSKDVASSNVSTAKEISKPSLIKTNLDNDICVLQSKKTKPNNLAESRGKMKKQTDESAEVEETLFKESKIDNTSREKGLFSNNNEKTECWKKCSRKGQNKSKHHSSEVRTSKAKTRLKRVKSFSSKQRKGVKSEPSEASNKKENNKSKRVDIYCKDCEHTFKYQKNYDKHLEEGRCKHVCEYCGKVFLCGLTGNYKIHLKYHLKEKNHECDVCGRKYTEYRKLKEHYRVHTGEEPYMCEECGITFSTFGSLYSHKKNKHAGIGEKYYCSQCPKMFKGYSGLSFHMKYYHQTESEKPFSCSKCSKSFKTPDILKRHETVHKTTKDFKCDQCDAAFRRIQGLTEHKKRHTKEFTNFCPHCGKGFYTRQARLVHERCHTGEKPYKCGLCSYSCALNGNLKKHMKTHNKLCFS